MEFTAQAGVRVVYVFVSVVQSLPRMIKSKSQPTEFEIAALFSAFNWRNVTVLYFVTSYSVVPQALKKGYKLQVSESKIYVLQRDKVGGHKEWLGIWRGDIGVFDYEMNWCVWLGCGNKEFKSLGGVWGLRAKLDEWGWKVVEYVHMHVRELSQVITVGG